MVAGLVTGFDNVIGPDSRSRMKHTDIENPYQAEYQEANSRADHSARQYHVRK